MTGAPPFPAPFKRRNLALRLLSALALLLLFLAAAGWAIRWIVSSAPQRDVQLPASMMTSVSGGFDLSGQIVDPQGQPVASARIVAIPAGKFPDNPAIDAARQGHADPTGAFVLHHQPAGHVLVSVAAPGCAPQTREITLVDNLAPIQFILAPGRILHGRVHDSSGAPVPNANVNINQWHGDLDVLHASANTNAAGAFVLRGVPTDAFSIQANKVGNTSPPLAIAPGNDRVELIVSAAPHIHGKVIDQRTRKPVAAFTIVPGIQPPNNQPPIFDPSLSRQFTGGQYDLSLDGFPPNTESWLIQIQARGYEPNISPAIRESREMNYEIKSGHDFQGRILAADKTPVNHAIVSVVLPGQTLYISNGQIPPHQPTTTTGPDGRFDLPQQGNRLMLMAMSDEGYAQIRQNALPKTGDIRLTPWANVDGAFLLDGKPAPAARMAFRTLDSPSADANPPLIEHNGNTLTDSNGHFHFDHLPPGPLTVYQVIESPMPSGDGVNWNVGISQTLTTSPGKTSIITLAASAK